jgi:hypothetical protein
VDLFQFQKDIAHLPEATLRQLNSVLVAKINSLHRAKTAAAVAAFSVGQLVSFTSRHGTTETMRIDRINSKTVSGKCVRTGMGWRVSPSFLRPAAPPTAPAAPAKPPVTMTAPPAPSPSPKPAPAPAPGLQYGEEAGVF